VKSYWEMKTRLHKQRAATGDNKGEPEPGLEPESRATGDNRGEPEPESRAAEKQLKDN